MPKTALQKKSVLIKKRSNGSVKMGLYKIEKEDRRPFNGKTVLPKCEKIKKREKKRRVQIVNLSRKADLKVKQVYSLQTNENEMYREYLQIELEKNKQDQKKLLQRYFR